jgi:TRAP-type C4-dicarboxylate transport system permease small subunit
MYRLILKIDSYYSKFISSLLLLNVALLVILACYSIVSRWLQLTNLWVDPLNRHLVLLLVFLGSTIAIDKKKHLKIDVLNFAFENKVSERFVKFVDLIFLFITSIIIFFLFISGVKFWLSELEFPVDAFLNLKQYHLAIIIPLGFVFMLKKYFFLLLKNTYELFLIKSNS